MTETAEQAKQDEATAQERDSFLKRERERAQAAQQAAAEEAARVRAGLRSQWEDKYSTDNIKPDMVSKFASLWKGADLQAVEFAVGLSNIKDVNDYKAREGIYTLTSQADQEFSYINGKSEFIGLTARQAKANPMSQQTADDIAVTALARGWKNVNVSGSQAEKDMLWIAAQKYGLVVNNHIPSPEARNAFEDYKNNAESASSGMAAGAPAQTSDLTVVPINSTIAGTSVATRPAQQEPVDAEWEEVKKPALPAPQTRFLLTHDKGDDDNKPGPSKPAGPSGP